MMDIAAMARRLSDPPSGYDYADEEYLRSLRVGDNITVSIGLGKCLCSKTVSKLGAVYIYLDKVPYHYKGNVRKHGLGWNFQKVVRNLTAASESSSSSKEMNDEHKHE